MITNAAVSILNAIPTGIGSAIGIKLPLTATIQSGGNGCCNDGITNRIVQEAFGIDAQDLTVSVASDIPQGYGLKSSSALTTAVIGEFAASNGISMSKEEICRKSAYVSRRIGLSVTGAMDDAAASVFDGIVVSDNRIDHIVANVSVKSSRIIVAIPRLQRPAQIREKLCSRDFTPALDRLMDTDYEGCSRLNGYLVGEALGYPIEPLRKIEELGSDMFGYSGNGPAIYATCDDSRFSSLYEYMKGIGRVIVTETRGKL
ncbi:MAG TPA: shikimate kinase [Thermoplasmataceae archaeon]|nr:shikimate kinase [Thermoplasmataceae archaeon]